MSGLLLKSPVGPLWLTAADGALTGYAAGLDVKRRLLELEGVRLEQGPRGWYTA